MRRTLLAAFFTSASILPITGCKSIEAPPPPPQVISVRVTSDPGRPVIDAALLFDGKKVAMTGADGVGVIKLVGKDGETFRVTVSCPEGFESPAQPVQVMLKRLTDTTKTPEYAVSCPPKTRSIVVAVRTENGVNLPVMYLGREVARTDSSGSAHVLLKLEPGEQFALTLATGDDKLINPQNPVASFVVSNQDAVVRFDQPFKLPPKPVYRAGPRQVGPRKM